MKSRLSAIEPKGLSVYIYYPHSVEAIRKAVNEETSSFESWIHFGHCIVGCKSTIILHYHAVRVSVVIAHAIELEQWSQRLSVMLEKNSGKNSGNKATSNLIDGGQLQCHQ
jgi:hypothetical protein